MKRFSDTGRFSEPWYRTLPPALKVAWEYLWAHCDNAGVWHPDFGLAEFQIGMKVKWAELIERTGRIIVLAPEKWMIRGFVEFQCGAPFSKDSRPHVAVMALLRSHGVSVSDSLCIDYPEGTDTPQYKHKDKDRDGMESPEGKGAAPAPAAVAPVIPDDLILALGFEQQWKTYLDHRKALGHPATPQSQQALLQSLAERPRDATKAIHTAVELNWRGFKWEWYDNSQQSNKNGHSNNRPGATDRNAGTLNAGASAQYAGIGKVRTPPAV